MSPRGCERRIESYQTLKLNSLVCRQLHFRPKQVQLLGPVEARISESDLVGIELRQHLMRNGQARAIDLGSPADWSQARSSPSLL